MYRYSEFYLIIIFTLVISLQTLGEKQNETSKREQKECRKCGRRIPALEGSRGYDRIIDGRIVKPTYKYPWIVKLDAERNCAGSIISTKYILTSAFCFTKKDSDYNTECLDLRVPSQCFIEKSEMQIRLPWKDSSKFRETLKADELLPHPEYHHLCKHNDIGLIRLAQEIECNSFKQPICLPTDEIKEFRDKLTITGWGQITADGIIGSRFLREGEMKQINPRRCSSHDKKCFQTNTTMIICTVGTHKQQTPCKGDSGGATFAGFNRAYHAVGITTLPHSILCQPSKSVVYTRVSAYINWIKHYVEELPTPYKNFVRVEDLEIDTEPFQLEHVKDKDINDDDSP